MRKTFLMFVTTLFLFAVVAAANDPWKDKPYASWDEKDVHKILSDSPWAKRVDVMSGGGGGGESQQSGPGEGGEGAGQTGVMNTNRASQRTGGANMPTVGKTTSFIARWYSSRTIREAQARGDELKGASREDAERKLTITPSSYIVWLDGPVRGFSRGGEDALKQVVYLEVKKTHAKIAPTRVAFIREGQNVESIFFEFPKKTDNGEAVIAADEKSVDFNVAAGKSPLKFHFDLTKMTDKEGLDL